MPEYGFGGPSHGCSGIGFHRNHRTSGTDVCLEALANMRRWNITPFELIAVGHGITEVNAQKLMDSGLLADGEFNDGLIVVETALASIPTLITSDKHLLTINPPQLVQKLNEFHLAPVSIYASSAKFMGKFFRLGEPS